MCNNDILKKAAEKNVELQEIAKTLEIDIRQFNRLLLREMLSEDKDAIFDIIDSIAENKASRG